MCRVDEAEFMSGERNGSSEGFGANGKTKKGKNHKLPERDRRCVLGPIFAAEMNPTGKHWSSQVRPAPGLAPPRRDQRLGNPWLRAAHRNSFTILFIVLLVIFVMQGWVLAATFLVQGSIVAFLISGTMAIQAIRYSDRLLGWICVAGAVTVVANWIWWIALTFLPESIHYGARGAGLLVLAMVLAVLIGAMVYHLWHNDYTGRNALFCAASSYLLIGFLWSCFFALISYYIPGAFADNGVGASVQMEGRAIHESFHRFFYFSMITITTVGYGDMTPVASLARSLAWMEAAIGQFFFALILTRLVSSQFVQSVERISHSKDSETPPGEMDESGIIQAINPASGYQTESNAALPSKFPSDSSKSP